MKVEQFEDLECWKASRELVKMVYKATSEEPFSRDWGLKDQIQRAAVSVMSNIAEGFESSTHPEFSRFLSISIRSCTETRSDLYIALDLRYLSVERFNEIMNQAKKCSNLTKGLLKYLRTQKIKNAE